MPLTHEDVERILHIIDQSGYDEIKIEFGDLKLHVRRHDSQGGAFAAASPMANAAPPAAEAIRPENAPSTPATTRAAPPSPGVGAPSAAAPESIPENLVAVRAPMLGTFYRAPSPGAPPFTSEGAQVSADDTVCLIEVMKLFNTLKAGVRGRVVRFLVENGALVEYDQPLLLIDPQAAA